MGQSPTTPNPTIALETEDLDLLDEPVNVVVDLAPASAAPRPPDERRGGAWLVVIVYVIAITALALAVYERFFT